MSAKLLPQYVAAFVVCIGGANFGTSLSWTANISDGLLSGKLNNIPMNTAELSLVGSMCPLGATFMCLLIGYPADYIGRKLTCYLSMIPCVVGWILIIFPFNLYMVYAGRFLTGVAGGAFIVVGPLYTTEIAQKHIRGTLGTLVQFFISFGALHAYVMGWALPMQWYNTTCLIMPSLFLIFFMWQPETPFYYIKIGDTEKASKSFARLRGKDYDFTEEQEVMTHEIESQRYLKDFKHAIRSRAAIKSTIICFSLMYFQKLCGINAIVFYGKQIMIQSNVSVAPHFCVVGMGFCSFAGVIVSVWLVDYFGRTTLMMVSLLGCFTGTFVLAIYFSIRERVGEHHTKSVELLPMLCILLFRFAYNVGIGGLPWVTSAEMFSPELKAKLGAPAAAFNWFLAMLVAEFYFPVSQAVGVDTTLYVFSLMSMIGFLFVLLIVPETKNKTYVEILPELEKFWKYW